MQTTAFQACLIVWNWTHGPLNGWWRGRLICITWLTTVNRLFVVCFHRTQRTWIQLIHLKYGAVLKQYQCDVHQVRNHPEISQWNSCSTQLALSELNRCSYILHYSWPCGSAISLSQLRVFSQQFLNQFTMLAPHLCQQPALFHINHLVFGLHSTS